MRNLLPFKSFFFSIGKVLFVLLLSSLFSLFLVFRSIIIMSWHWILWVYPVWNIFKFVYCRFISLAEFGKFSAIISSSTFSVLLSFSSPSYTLMTQNLLFKKIMPQVPEAFMFLTYCLSVAQIDLYCFVFQFTNSFLSLILLLSPSIELFTSAFIFYFWNVYLDVIYIL